MGPLAGLRIVEIAGIGPGQLCGMLLAEMGADVLRITRLGAADPGLGLPPRFDLMNRSRPALPVDLKHPDGVELVGTDPPAQPGFEVQDAAPWVTIEAWFEGRLSTRIQFRERGPARE